jgi:hypothetical protein
MLLRTRAGTHPEPPSISRSLLGSSGASRSTVPMPGKSTYRHAARSITSSTDAAPATGEGSSAVEITTSRPPVGGGSTEPSSESTITMSAPLEPALAGGSNAAWGNRPSLLNGGGGHWWRRRARLLHCGRHGQPLLNLHRERLGARKLGTRLGGHDPHALGQAL